VAITNSEIVYKVKLLSNLLELHNDNPFKIRSLQNAYSTLKKVVDPIGQMDKDYLGSLPGIGKSIAQTIADIAADGTSKELDILLEKTPEGIVEMFNIKGIGPKKIAQFWHGMGLMSVGELVYYCTENRLKDAKGFGEKSQNDILEKAMLYLSSRDKWLYARIEAPLAEFEDAMRDSGILQYQLTGQAYRCEQIVEDVHYIVEADDWPPYIENFEAESGDDNMVTGIFKEQLRMRLSLCLDDVRSEAFVESFSEKVDIDSLFDRSRIPQAVEEEEIFGSLGLRYIPRELRWDQDLCRLNPSGLIDHGDIRGVVHCHTTYSDGIHTVREMCAYAREQGYEYIAITDHSQSAFYANGLIVERVLQQHREIDQVAAEFPDLKIFKSIESDILNDGRLDYEDEFLERFDFVIGSVHSVLNMDVERATDRLVRAIEHPSMHMLGHMTGRLLLARKGYPLHVGKIIDACVANGVAIELNANPQRLDMDHTLLRKATDKGVLISINPDAHSKQGIHDIRYGVIAGRCGGLEKSSVINTMDAGGFLLKLKGRGL